MSINSFIGKIQKSEKWVLHQFSENWTASHPYFCLDMVKYFSERLSVEMKNRFTMIIQSVGNPQ